MAQYDIIFSQNISSSGIDFSEKVLTKASALGMWITQDPATGALSWSNNLKTPIIDGTISGSAFVSDLSTAPAAGKIPDALTVYNKIQGAVAAAEAMIYKGAIDCALSPNYPAASRGWTYKVSVAGKIGGASGLNVEVGDTVICETSNSGGTQAAVGVNFNIIQGNVDGGIYDSRISGTTGIVKRTSTSPMTYTVSTLAPGDVGLPNVDNTSDANKPVSTAAQSALNLKAPIASPTFTGTVSGISKSMVGLANVDNTADTAKPVSTAQQSALDLKASLASPTFTGTVSGITKTMVGLANVDNTADSAKPVSTAQQAALDLKLTKNTAITGASKTKVTFDANGLITAGTDAGIADITGLTTALAAKVDTSVFNTQSAKTITRSATTPGSISASGVVGEISTDANYLYVCTAVNTWKRIPLASF
jgi:hypothetical protein